MTRRHSPVRFWLAFGALAAVAVVLAAVAPYAPGVDLEREAAARCANGYRLTPGRPVPGRLRQGGVHVYRIARERNEVLDAVVEQHGLDVAVALRAPSGHILIEVNSPNGNRGPEPVFTVAEVRGEYCLEILSGEDHGDYTVRVDPPRQASAADRARADAVSAFSRAEQFRRKREFDRALPEYQRTLDLWSAIGDRFQQGITLYRLGWTHQKMGHAAEAIDPFLSALPQLQGHPVETVAVLNRLGVAYQERGQTGDAFGIYQKALAISQKEGDPSGQAGALNGLGQIYANWGEFESARRDYERSLELWRQLGYAAYEADLLGNLAELDLVVGRLEDARDASSKALAIHQERRDQGGEINSLRKLGEVLTQLDKPKPALQVLERSVDLARKIGNKRYWLWSLEALGVALLREKSLDRASTVYDQARDLSLELQSPHDTAEVVSDLAEIAELRGDRPAALAGFEQARAMYERLGEPAAVAWTLASRASAYQAADSLPEARADLEAALAIVENLRVKPRASASRASFLASRHGYYETYIDVLMRLGRRRSDKAYEQLAFEASERARARALLDDLGRSGTLLLSGVDGKLQEQAVGLEHRLRDLEGQLQGISSDGREADASRSAVKAEIEATVEKQDALRKQIQQNHPHYAALTQPHPLSLQEIQEQVLEDGTVLLAYSLGEDRSYLWLIRRSSWTSRELPGRRVIEAAAIDLYNALSRQNPKANAEAVRATAAKLSQLVIQPIASELGQDRLVVVADGALQYIPFATLPASPALPGRLLIREHEIVSLPSASIPAVLRQEIAGRPSPPKLLAALADPVFQASDERVPEAFRKISSYSSSTGLADVLRSARDLGISGFGRLRYSQIEAKAIVSLAPPGMSFLALGFDATRDLALQSILRQYRILHFATHSLLDSRHPDLSGIVLSLVDAHGRPLDGFLRAYDIYNLSLPVDLVVLSACQTALGKDVKGEGLISLTRGFMYAGAPRVVVSLWNVSDRGTAEFMTRFYRSMLVGGLKPAAALRAAQISMSEDPQWSPNSWAGFVLQGEWR